ncbi:MAG TPA: TetR/AcrR family transcriptional regulator [Amycolatopsis sp.]|nr:TetR/AcrR family transcriptional regulator [Amycolatopsis sp.]
MTEGRKRGPLRADAQRNYDQILAAAEAAVARDGADASLEEIARQAGVGSATLHRHFPSRQILLEAVFSAKVETLCRQAKDLAADAEPSDALITWLRAVVAHATSNRGLATALLRGAHESFGTTCHAMITDAGRELLERAHEAEAIRPGVEIVDLLTLANAIALATEQEPNAGARAEQLLDLAIYGVRPT